MALSIDELLTPLTEDQVFESFLSICATLGLPTSSWRQGGAIRTILRVLARTYSGYTAVMAAFVKSGFLETAEGDWLTKLAANVYGVTRRDATFAREDVTLTNAGGGLYTQAAGTVTVIAPGTKKAYRNVAGFTLNPLETLDVEFEAVEIGSASSAAIGTITELETTLQLVTVSNPRPFIAIDAETDAEVREACRAKIGALSVRGPRTAYAYAIRVAKRLDGNPVNINRWRVSSSSSTGRVNVWLASPSGVPIGDDVTAVEGSVEQIARPDGVRVTVSPVTEVTVSRTLTVWATRTDGVSAADVKALVLAAFVREQATFPIGGLQKPPSVAGKIYADWIAAKAIAAHASIYDVDGTGADVTLTAGQIPALDFTVNVKLVDLTEPA